MSTAQETQSMREIRLLRGTLPRKGGGLTGMEFIDEGGVRPAGGILTLPLYLTLFLGEPYCMMYCTCMLNSGASIYSAVLSLHPIHNHELKSYIHL